MFHWFFPTPDDGIAAVMHQHLEVFDREMFGDPQFSNRNNLNGNLLVIAGLDQLHRMDAFFWLKRQIAEQVSLYLIDLSIGAQPWPRGPNSKSMPRCVFPRWRND